MNEIQPTNESWPMPDSLKREYEYMQLTGPGLVDAPQELQNHYLSLDAEEQLAFQAFQRRAANVLAWRQKHITPANIGTTFLGLTGVTANIEYGVTPGRAGITVGAAMGYYVIAKGLEKGVKTLGQWRSSRSMGVEVEG